MAHGAGTWSPPKAKGLTLVEVLVVIAVTAIVFGIVLPALRSMGERARTTASLADLRSDSQSHDLWSTDHQDRMFNLGIHDDHFVRTGRLFSRHLVVFLENPQGPPYQIHYAYQTGDSIWRLGLERWLTEPLPARTTSRYTAAAYTDPALWNGNPDAWERWPGDQHYRFVLRSETAYPGNKARLAHAEDESYLVATFDGGVTRVTAAQVLPQMGFLNGSPDPDLASPGVGTINGVLGRDIR